jgi:Xaa-Pro aminopeptidase
VTRAGVIWEDVDRTAERVFEAQNHGDDFWHGLGHFVGLEVHDAGDYSKPLPVNAVLTIEPGLYLPPRGFGVRIEDEFLLNRTGAEHMTRELPRRPADIEALVMSGR